jgi:hypothetical protein
MAPTNRQDSTDFIKSPLGRGKSWRDWINRKSTTQKSPAAIVVEGQESKQHEKQHHKAETQGEQPTLLKRRRAVSFALIIDTFHTLPLEDYTQEEISASWFDDYDYDDITFNCENIIREMNNKSNESIKRKNMHCSRGLERMTNIGSALVNCNRNDSYDAVLEEQDVKWDNQEDDHGERIAQLYREVASRRCHVEAHQRGMQDALVAEELLLADEEGRKNKEDEKEEEVQTVGGVLLPGDAPKEQQKYSVTRGSEQDCSSRSYLYS